MLVEARSKIWRRRGNYPDGFTLVEVLATLVLIAIVIPVAMRGISLATRMAGHSKKQVEAVSLAKAKLTEIVASKDWQNGDQSGDFGSDRPDYQWSLETSSWSGSSLRQLDLHVFWDTGRVEHSVTLTTLVYEQND
jgi:prepilin-type N-terminal cleavage/methylation domain-containing protein